MRPCEGGRPATWGVASPMLNWGVCWVLAFLFLPAIPLSAHITIPETSKTLSTAGEIAQAPDSASMESGAPEVPQVNIVGLPRETQDQVAKAYAAARKQPQDAGVVGKLGMLLDSYHRSEDAALCYRRAHLLEPAAFKWLYYWGSLLLRERKMGEALPILTSALRLDPEYLPARLKMGEALLGAGKTEEAGRIYDGIAETEKALDLDPSLAKAHLNLLILYAKTGKAKQAEEQYKALVALSPGQFSEAYYNYGVLLRDQGKFDEAEQAFRKTLALAPTNDAAHDNLGYLLERQG